MDQTILTLDQHQKDPSVDIIGRGKYRLRHAVRAIVTDDNGSIPLLHAAMRDYYKLPGGGIDGNEDLQTALTRELKEEIGSSARIIQELGQVIEWRDSEHLKQISYCFIATLIGDKGEPNFTKEEIAEGFEVVWATDVTHAISLVASAADSADIDVSFMTTRDAAILRAAARKML